jgi:hypothetical protein
LGNIIKYASLPYTQISQQITGDEKFSEVLMAIDDLDKSLSAAIRRGITPPVHGVDQEYNDIEPIGAKIIEDRDGNLTDGRGVQKKLIHLDEDANSKHITDTEKTKLSGIETGAQVNTITSVAGKTGAVTLASSDLSNSLVNAVVEVKFDDANPTVLLTAQNIIITSIHVYIKTAWDGTQADNILEIGDEDDVDGFITDLGGSGANELKSTGIKTEQLCLRGGTYFYESCSDPRKVKYYGSTPVEIRARVANSDATQGEAIIYIQYIKLT